MREAEAAVAAAEAEARRAAEEAERRKAAALAEKADGLLKAGHAANKQGDYAKARPPLRPPPTAFLAFYPPALFVPPLAPLPRPLATINSGHLSPHSPAPPNIVAASPSALSTRQCLAPRAANCASDPLESEKQNSGRVRAQARHFFLEAHALQNKPAALLSAANMALKLREASTAKREYEQASRHTPRHNLCTSPIHRLVPPYTLLLPSMPSPADRNSPLNLTTPSTMQPQPIDSGSSKVLASPGLTVSVTRSTEVKLLEATAIVEKQVYDPIGMTLAFGSYEL